MWRSDVPSRWSRDLSESNPDQCRIDCGDAVRQGAEMKRTFRPRGFLAAALGVVSLAVPCVAQSARPADAFGSVYALYSIPAATFVPEFSGTAWAYQALNR